MLKFVKKSSVATIAHPEGKPAWEITFSGKVVGEVEPYSSTYDRKPKGCRYATSRRSVTRYYISLNNVQLSLYDSYGYMNGSDARKAVMRMEEKIRAAESNATP